MLEVARRPVEAAPDFAFGHSILATAEADAAHWNAMPDLTAELAADARSEAQRALQLDPRQSEAYVVLASMEPPGAYRQTEALLLKGLAVEGRPALTYAALMTSEAELLREVGRLSAAMPLDEHALAIDRLSPVKSESLIEGYVESGEEAPAEALLAQGLQRWPNHPQMRDLRLWVAAFYQPPDAALRLLDDPAARPADLTPAAADAWHAFLAAKRDPGPTLAAKASSLIVSADDSGALDHTLAIPMLSDLGHTDQAFGQADKALSKGGLEPSFLFTRPAAPMRRDPRFWALAKRLGLVDYWRATGKWPDFCAESGLPYDCKSEAARSS
jgi:hypothetical protein